MAASVGFEPTTLRLTGERSALLSYEAMKMVEEVGVAPTKPEGYRFTDGWNYLTVRAHFQKVVGQPELESGTYCLKGRSSNQLSY
jgi:hypothetical protein